MTWKLRMIDTETPTMDMKPGDIKYVPYYKEGHEKPGETDKIGYRFLSDRYLRNDYHKRDPLLICLPDGSPWCIDQVSTSSTEGWQVSGEVPALTTSPSIVSKGYHGWLENGILSDDLEGRKYGNT